MGIAQRPAIYSRHKKGLQMITIVLPISRPDYLKQLFARLEFLDYPSSEVNLLSYVDGNQQLFELARNLTVASKFAEKLCVYRSKGMPNVGSVKGRRRRIAAIHNEIKGLLNKTDYVFLLEDDTIPPRDALTKLVRLHADHPYAGLVSGIELGRWGWPHIGAWNCDDVYEPKKITSIPLTTGVVEVDATGLYCCLMKFKTYMDHHFEPFEDLLGPDVNFGIKHRREGLVNYVDQSIQCTHLTKRGAITIASTDVVQVEIFQSDISKTGWLMRAFGQEPMQLE